MLVLTDNISRFFPATWNYVRILNYYFMSAVNIFNGTNYAVNPEPSVQHLSEEKSHSNTGTMVMAGAIIISVFVIYHLL